MGSASSSQPDVIPADLGPLTDPNFFKPFPEPTKYSWQTAMAERSQSLNTYVKHLVNVPRGYAICMIMLIKDEMDQTIVDKISEYVAMFYQIKIKAIVANFSDYKFIERQSKDEPHTQYRADSIRDKLRHLVPDRTYCTLIWTDVDIYPHTWLQKFNFVFGEAEYSKYPIGVFSNWRFADKNFVENDELKASTLAKDMLAKDTIFNRSLKIITHEIGHMFGLNHCIDHNCLMCGINGVMELDVWSMTMCPNCIRKLHLCLDLDLNLRQKKLVKFYQTHGITSEYEKNKRILDAM